MTLRKYEPQALGVLRIVTGLLFGEHGTQKILNWPGGHGALPVMSFNGFGGLLELVGGLLILLGLFTSPTSFILAGEMAVAYFKEHQPKDFFPIMNKGEDAILFCFIFLYMIFAGGGAWSVDSILAKRKPQPA